MWAHCHSCSPARTFSNVSPCCPSSMAPRNRNNRLRRPVAWAATIGAAERCLRHRSVKSSTPCTRTWWRRWVADFAFEVASSPTRNSLWLSCPARKWRYMMTPYFYKSCRYSMVQPIECRCFLIGTCHIVCFTSGCRVFICTEPWQQRHVEWRYSEHTMNIGRYCKILEIRSMKHIRANQYRINTAPCLLMILESQISLLRRIERFVSGHVLFHNFISHLRFVDPSFPQTKKSVYSQTYLQIKVSNSGIGTVQICGTWRNCSHGRYNLSLSDLDPFG